MCYETPHALIHIILQYHQTFQKSKHFLLTRYEIVYAFVSKVLYESQFYPLLNEGL
jgi:hypothetical protein